MRFINIIKATAIKANGVKLMGCIKDFWDKMCIFCTRICILTFIIYIFNFNWKCMRLGKQNCECNIMLTLKAKKSMTFYCIIFLSFLIDYAHLINVFWNLFDFFFFYSNCNEWQHIAVYPCLINIIKADKDITV